MDRYQQIREDIQEILASCANVLDALEQYERHPVPSKQLQLDVHLSGTEIRLTNTAKALRERLLV